MILWWNEMIRSALVCHIAVIFFAGVVQSECEFPDFVQSERSRNIVLPWITMRKYDSENMYRYIEEINIHVTGDRYEVRKLTDDDDIKLYERKCVRRQARDTFLVQHFQENNPVLYFCIKFVDRGNVVQTLSSYNSSFHETSLCDTLEVDEWPWLASQKKEWMFCPLSGGYRFQVYDPTRNGEKVCSGRKLFWLESECTKGEGIRLQYPGECSPFGQDRWETLTCFASWREGDFIFILLLAPGHSLPQYTMRFPARMETDFTVQLYFNAVTPYEWRGVPPAGSQIRYLELRMSRAGSNSCFDEPGFANSCDTLPPDIRCGPNKQDDCRLACGLCDPTLDIATPKCQLPDTYQKTWSLHEPKYKEDVVITNTTVTFGDRQKFVCKEKRDGQNMFKFVSKYDNGCRPRYTCMDFQIINANVLRYRRSASYDRDVDIYKLCRFMDDEYPLKDSIRSQHYKHLVSQSEPSQPVPCRLAANIQFKMTPQQVELNETNTCKGNVTDWDSRTCSSGTTLSVRSGTCDIDTTEHMCLAVIEEEYVTLLLTQRRLREEYNCWVMTSYDKTGRWFEGRVMHKMATVQCSAQAKHDVYTEPLSETTFYLYDDTKTSWCPVTEPPYASIHDRGPAPRCAVDITCLVLTIFLLFLS